GRAECDHTHRLFLNSRFGSAGPLVVGESSIEVVVRIGDVRAHKRCRRVLSTNNRFGSTLPEKSTTGSSPRDPRVRPGHWLENMITTMADLTDIFAGIP